MENERILRDGDTPTKTISDEQGVEGLGFGLSGVSMNNTILITGLWSQYIYLKREMRTKIF